MSALAAEFGREPQPYIERWRPAFRGFQRMRIVGTAGATYAIEAELDGPIAVGFTGWPEANAFLGMIDLLHMSDFV